MTVSDGSVSSVEACRSTLWMSTVAKRRLAPMSSATSSTLVLVSPSSVSQLRCSSLPVTTIRAPRVKLRATFSARSRQQTTSYEPR